MSGSFRDTCMEMYLLHMARYMGLFGMDLGKGD